MLKSFDLTCKKGYYPHFFNTVKNFDYVGPYTEPKFYVRTTRQLKSEPNFWTGMRSNNSKFSAISRSSWPTVKNISMH